VLPHGFHLEEHFVTTEDGYILRLFRIPCKLAGQAATPHPPYASLNSNSSDADFIMQTANYSSSSSRRDSSSGSSSSSLGENLPPSLHGTPPACAPVLLQHALMDSSAGWLLLGKDKSLALQLAASGFDVWMGNSRGNRFSRNHTYLNPDEPRFWEWSWADMAEHDLPAQVEKVVEVTGQDKMVYFGFSQVSMLQGWS
jgi:pimeloyl-ACP methyl ester carboxylesterase